jgi:hypothetical protein
MEGVLTAPVIHVSSETLAISPRYTVILLDNDINSNLEYVLDALHDNAPHKALGLFHIIVKYIKNNSNNVQDVVTLMNRCLEGILELIQRTMEVINEGFEKKQATKATSLAVSDVEKKVVGDGANVGGYGSGVGTGGGGDVLLEEGVAVGRREKTFSKDEGITTTDSGDVEFWKTYRSSLKLHQEAFELLSSVYQYKTPWYWVSEKLKITIQAVNKLFCPILKRYFYTINDLVTARIDYLGFNPSSPNAFSSSSISTAPTSTAASISTAPSITSVSLNRAPGMAISSLPPGLSSLPPPPNLPSPPNLSLPSSMSSVASSTVRLSHLTSLLHDYYLPSLIPDSSFEKERISLCKVLEEGLRNYGFLKENQFLKLYGSSFNRFGGNSSDIDLCIVNASSAASAVIGGYGNPQQASSFSSPFSSKSSAPVSASPLMTSPTSPSSASSSALLSASATVNLTPIEKLKVMCDLSDCLENLGMKEVKSLLTARVPIIEFLDPMTSLPCDITFHNPLAIANTNMLRCYSKIDLRVRQLAYLVKHWSKCRDINCPQQGTLSSYGYILTIIHFLQVRKAASFCFLHLFILLFLPFSYMSSCCVLDFVVFPSVFFVLRCLACVFLFRVPCPTAFSSLVFRIVLHQFYQCYKKCPLIIPENQFQQSQLMVHLVISIIFNPKKNNYIIFNNKQIRIRNR